MEGLTLYQVSGRYAELAAREAHDETLTEAEAFEMSHELGEMLTKKSMGIIGYARNLESMAAAADMEIKRLQDIKIRIMKEQQRHYDRVKLAMEYMGATEITTGIGSLKIKKNPVSVEVLNIDDVPELYKTTTVTVKVDSRLKDGLLENLQGYENVTVSEAAIKNEIKDHFKETGELIPGVMIETTKTRLEIK